MHAGRLQQTCEKKTLDTREECGYIEMQLRRMFRVSADRKTRLWVCEKTTDERFQLMSDRSTRGFPSVKFTDSRFGRFRKYCTGYVSCLAFFRSIRG